MIYQGIELAHNRICPYIVQTPVFNVANIDKELGLKVHFKAEGFQEIGAFKANVDAETFCKIGSSM